MSKQIAFPLSLFVLGIKARNISRQHFLFLDRKYIKTSALIYI